MFERTRVDNMVQGQSVVVPAELTMDDQVVLKGDLLMPAGRPVHEVLNGGNVFIEFRAYGEESRLIAKSTIRALRLIQVPGTGQLRSVMRQEDMFDPYQVLGLRTGSSYEDVRKAYVDLAKTYHPDRYATAELPAEVNDYLSAMSRRINLAFQALEKSHRVSIGRAPTMAEPIYTSRPRA